MAGEVIEGPRWRRALGLGCAGLVLHLVLVLPNYPPALTWNGFAKGQLELPLLLLIAVALGVSRVGWMARALITLALTTMVILKTADLISFSALSRPFNPVTDLALIDAFLRLLVGTLGTMLTVLALIAALLALLAIAVGIWWALRLWAGVTLPRWGLGVSGAFALVATVGAVVDVGAAQEFWERPTSLPGSARTARIGSQKAATTAETLAELRSFRAQIASDPFSQAKGLFDRIDRDVLVIFVESYGRTSLDTPFYADLHRQTLARYEAALRDRGLATRSGLLASPTQGGQSWLAHATFANGLWIDNQVSYGAALSSGRQTLFHYAARSGLRTATVMPQITLEWPEVARMGFDEVYVAEDLGYRGLPFNWVTMPDQFTLAALDRILRQGDSPERLFAQVALVSSHAPWVPVPRIIPWEDVGDGSVFNDMASAGDPPRVVWRDRDRVREQYRLAVDYALQSVFEYALLHADQPPLLIILGDHQTGDWIALDDRPDVPVHVIGPDHLVDALAELAPDRGLLPGSDVPVIAMDRVRDILLNAFQRPAHAALGN